MLADHDDKYRSLLATALRRDGGFLVWEASDGKRALELVKAQSPDLVMFGIVMPAMNGFEACRKLKADESTRGLPVVLLTGQPSDPERLMSEKVGARGYQAKTAPMGALVRLAEQVVAAEPGRFP